MRSYANAATPVQFRRLRHLAYSAIRQFGIEPYRLRPIGHWENTTFLLRGRLEGARRNRRYLVRIHRPGYNSREYIETELKFLTDLAHNSEVLVPRPLQTQDGTYLATAGANGVPEKRLVSLFPYIAGHTLRRSVRDIGLVGDQMGKLHAFARQGTLQYGARRSFFDGAEEQLRSSQQFFVTVEKVLGTQRGGEVRSLIEKSIAWIDDRYGNDHVLPLIHADLHAGNLIKRLDGTTAVIDFDDCVYGPFELDVATSLLGYLGKEGSHYRERFLQAYRDVCDYAVDQHAVFHMSVLRLLWLGRWLSARKDNPQLHRELPGFIRRMDKSLVALSEEG